MDLGKFGTIEELNSYIPEFNRKYFPDSNLEPIIGGGKQLLPKLMLIFINPTKRNIASDSGWVGPRVPWIGIKPIWKVLAGGGIITSELGAIIQQTKNWTPEFSNSVYAELYNQGIYLTNIVKWAGEDATLPEKTKINLYTPIIKREIELVQPQTIITMGQIPLQALTNDEAQLNNYYQEMLQSSKPKYINFESSEFKTKILPCYFPVGMGRFNLPKAEFILKLAN